MKSGKQQTDKAWWLPGTVNQEFAHLGPYYNGDPMTSHDASNIFTTLGKYLKKFGFPKFQKEYGASSIRKTGINVSKLLNFTLDEISYVR